MEFIRKNLDDTFSCRFNPLIYFWGTNPQTALFGYLQGQPSVDEMPRTHFQRQYLYVSDAQYLTSNVDLSEHYNDIWSNGNIVPKNNRKHRKNRVKNKMIVKKAGELARQQQVSKHHFLQLQVDPASIQQQQQQLGSSYQLNKNICLALGNILDDAIHNDGSLGPDVKDADNQSKLNLASYSTSSATATSVEAEAEAEVGVAAAVAVASKAVTKELDMSSSKSGSSSDSGVFPGHSSSTSSSTSSLADVAIENKCVCKMRYEAESQFEPEIFQSSSNPRSFDRINERDVLGDSEFPTSGTNYSDKSDPSTTFIPREHYEFGQCALDWHLGSHKNYHKNKLVALISAGMTTGSDKKYVTDTVTTLEQLGYEVCVFIRRGVGGLKLLSTKFFSPSKWHDFEAAIQSVRQQRPGAHLVAIGFSFGSIELCRYLSMSGKRSLVDAALLISCPFDPDGGGINMRKRTLNRKIDAYLARNLGKQLYQAMFSGSNSTVPQTTTTIAKKSANFKENTQLSNHNGSIVNLATLTKIKSLVEFERDYNRVLQNYPSRKAYADDSRLHDHIAAITTPTLCLSSEDDFMAPLKLLPLDQIEANKNLCMILTKRGGHMAFIDGLLWPKKPYFAQRIIGRYMKAVKESLLLNTRCSSNVGTIDITIDLTKNPNSFDFYGHHIKLQHKQQQQQQRQQKLQQQPHDNNDHHHSERKQDTLFAHKIQNQYQHVRLQMPNMTEISV